MSVLRARGPRSKPPNAPSATMSWFHLSRMDERSRAVREAHYTQTLARSAPHGVQHFAACSDEADLQREEANGVVERLRQGS